MWKQGVKVAEMPLTMPIEMLLFRNCMHRKGIEHLMVNM
jgi:hypothetical protein